MDLKNIDAIKAALDQKIPNKVCPMCGKKINLNLEDKIYLLISPNYYEDGSISLEGDLSAIEPVCVCCEHCGYIMLFSPDSLLSK